MSHLHIIKALNFWSFKYSPLCQDLPGLLLPEIFRADEEDAETLGMGVTPPQRIPENTQKDPRKHTKIHLLPPQTEGQLMSAQPQSQGLKSDFYI